MVADYSNKGGGGEEGEEFWERRACKTSNWLIEMWRFECEIVHIELGPVSGNDLKRTLGSMHLVVNLL